MVDEISSVIAIESKRNAVLELAMNPDCGLISRGKNGFDYSDFFLCVDDFFEDGRNRKWEDLDCDELDQIIFVLESEIRKNVSLRAKKF